MICQICCAGQHSAQGHDQGIADALTNTVDPQSQAGSCPCSTAGTAAVAQQHVQQHDASTYAAYTLDLQDSGPQRLVTTHTPLSYGLVWEGKHMLLQQRQLVDGQV
jgi:hypothetical protein